MEIHNCLFYKEDFKDKQVQLRRCDSYEAAQREAERMIEAFKYWGGGPVPVSVDSTKWTKNGKYAGEAYPRIEYGEELYIAYARENGTKYGYYKEKVQKKENKTMTREMIIKELVNRGYAAEATNTVKNGVEYEGILIRTQNGIAPVIYTEGLIAHAKEKNLTLNDVMETVIQIYNKEGGVALDVKIFEDRNYILKNLSIRIQKKSNENLVKRPCMLEGIESFLCIQVNIRNKGDGSVKVSEDLLQRVNITEEEAWKVAEENVCKETVLIPMKEILAELMKCSCDDLTDMDMPLYVITNKSRVNGASAIINHEVLAELGRKCDTDKIVVLPSSIHEMILLPYTDDVDIDMFTEMVKEVNETQVAPAERLTDRAYIITI